MKIQNFSKKFKTKNWSQVQRKNSSKNQMKRSRNSQEGEINKMNTLCLMKEKK